MKEFIEKLIGRLEEEKNETYSEMTLLLDKEYLLPCNMNQIDMEEYRCSTFEEVISIVNELAEEYNNGWIPCSERLPEEGVDVLVWFEYYRYGSYNRLYQTVGISYTYHGDWSGFVNGSSGWKQLRIIAWQPLPAPYKEGVTENE